MEAPATPGLSNSDLQQGDVQRLEQAQKIAPRPKRTQPSAAPPPRQQSRKQQPTQGPMEIPDPIAFASQRIGGKNPTVNMGGQRRVDPSPWVPLLREMAMRPLSGGTLPANYFNLMQQYVRRPVVSNSVFIDLNELDAVIAEGL